MAVTEKQSESVKNEESPRYRLEPRYAAWTEDEKIVLQISLPGVKKENIEMKALRDHFMLRAKRDNIMYILNLDLNVEVVPKDIKAEYDEGLLRIEMKRYNPLDDAYDVPIN